MEVEMKDTRISGIVQGSTNPKKYNDKMQIGFTLKEDPNKWYNQQGEEAELKQVKEKILKKGAKIEFDYALNVVTNLIMLEEPKESMTGQWEDDIVNFETLLNAAHSLKKPFSIRTEMLDINLERKYALFKAVVEVYATSEEYTKYCIGEVSEESRHHMRMKLTEFEGHGDATAENVTGEFIKPHFIRMAETRAICRALRWYTNNATCSEEEKSEK